MTEPTGPTTVEATFDIDHWDEVGYDEPADGPKLTRVEVRKTYTGVLRGTGAALVLTAQGSGGGGYVASERIQGTLAGRTGTFVIQHSGRADGAELSSSGRVVPQSGTGELAGLSGEAYEASQGVLTLRCAFAD